ncbi:MAG: hypothetical protein M1825_001051 [Sarcosagium campestre]|nr:MAG: hypothetical protein M1825_001051 [Sarcosagium campestre]
MHWSSSLLLVTLCVGTSSARIPSPCVDERPCFADRQASDSGNADGEHAQTSTHVLSNRGIFGSKPQPTQQTTYFDTRLGQYVYKDGTPAPAPTDPQTTERSSSSFWKNPFKGKTKAEDKAPVIFSLSDGGYTSSGSDRRPASNNGDAPSDNSFSSDNSFKSASESSSSWPNSDSDASGPDIYSTAQTLDFISEEGDEKEQTEIVPDPEQDDRPVLEPAVPAEVPSAGLVVDNPKVPKKKSLGRKIIKGVGKYLKGSLKTTGGDESTSVAKVQTTDDRIVYFKITCGVNMKQFPKPFTAAPGINIYLDRCFPSLLLGSTETESMLSLGFNQFFGYQANIGPAGTPTPSNLQVVAFLNRANNGYVPPAKARQDFIPASKAKELWNGLEADAGLGDFAVPEQMQYVYPIWRTNLANTHLFNADMSGVYEAFGRPSKYKDGRMVNKFKFLKDFAKKYFKDNVEGGAKNLKIAMAFAGWDKEPEVKINKLVYAQDMANFVTGEAGPRTMWVWDIWAKGAETPYLIVEKQPW